MSAVGLVSAMGRAWQVRAWPVRRGTISEDAGFTMIETVVSLTIMSFAMAMFTTGVLQVYRTVQSDEARSTAQTQLVLATQRLDREVRYATGVSVPGVAGDYHYVEYLFVAHQATGSGVPTCGQWRLPRGGGTLAYRTWPEESLPGVAEPWRAVAFDVASDQPFTRLGPDVNTAVQRLRLRVTARAGAGATAATRGVDLVFPAVNTSPDTTSDTVCGLGRTVP